MPTKGTCMCGVCMCVHICVCVCRQCVCVWTVCVCVRENADETFASTARMDLSLAYCNNYYTPLQLLIRVPSFSGEKKVIFVL